MKTSVNQFVPNKFPFLFENKKITYKGKNLKTAYLIDLMHTLIVRKYFFNLTEMNLWSVILRQRYGTFYNRYVDWLIDHQILKIKSMWQAGAKSKTYKLILDFNRDQITRFKNTDKILLKKINKEKVILAPIYQTLVKDLYKIKLNYEDAKEHLTNEFGVGLLSLNKFNRNLLALDSIRDGEIYYCCDDYGRLHSNFTNLKKNLRNNFLRIDGEAVEFLDIKNSQPTFLAQMLINENAILTPELKSFIQHVKNGTFYSTFSELELSKQKVKNLVYQVLFGKNRAEDKSNTIFIKYWPELWQWIKDWKKTQSHYSVLSHNLQRVESELMYDKICTQVKQQLPNVTIFTVHDCIFFPESYKSIIQPIFDLHVDSVIKNLDKLLNSPVQ